MNNSSKIREQLNCKSIESFQLALEIYNKPTIKYRVEGFAIFICNSWELLLKSFLLSNGEDIYYPDNPNRSISLENSIKKIFTNDKDPLRRNLEKIIELRNTSTHFITQEYEMIYVSLFQACVFNYTEQAKKLCGIDITKHIPLNFLTLTVCMEDLDESKIIANYPGEIANKLLERNEQINSEENFSSPNYAIRVEHYHFLTKDKEKATSFVAIQNDSPAKIKILKEIKNPNETHRYSASNCLKGINKKLSANNIVIHFKGEPIPKFNMYHFGLFCTYYDIKNNESLAFKYTVHTPASYTYSQHTIDFIYNELKKDPEKILDHIKSSIKKSTPGAKEF